MKIGLVLHLLCPFTMKFTRYCLTHLISELPWSFEIQSKTIYSKCSFIWNKDLYKSKLTVKLKSNLYVTPVNIFPNFLYWYSNLHDTRYCLQYHDDVTKWKHLPLYWPFVRGIHRSPVNSLHKGQWRGALMFSLICVWINDWVNNREAGDLRCYCAHYDVIVMMTMLKAEH